MVFLKALNNVRLIFGDLIAHVFLHWAMCTTWWIAGGCSGNIFDNVKIIITLLSDANSTIGHHYFILNHLC